MGAAARAAARRGGGRRGGGRRGAPPPFAYWLSRRLTMEVTVGLAQQQQRHRGGTGAPIGGDQVHKVHIGGSSRRQRQNQRHVPFGGSRNMVASAAEQNLEKARRDRDERHRRARAKAMVDMVAKSSPQQQEVEEEKEEEEERKRTFLRRDNSNSNSTTTCPPVREEFDSQPAVLSLEMALPQAAGYPSLPQHHLPQRPIVLASRSRASQQPGVLAPCHPVPVVPARRRPPQRPPPPVPPCCSKDLQFSEEENYRKQVASLRLSPVRRRPPQRPPPPVPPCRSKDRDENYQNQVASLRQELSQVQQQLQRSESQRRELLTQLEQHRNHLASGASEQLETLSPPNTRSGDDAAQIAALKKQVELLQSLTAQHQGSSDKVGSNGWDGTLVTAECALRDAMERLAHGDMQAEPECEMWSHRVATHPDHLAAEQEKADAWDAKERPKREAALRRLRQVVPEDILHTTRSSLQEREGMTPVLVKRLWEKRVLWLVRMSRQSIAKIHPADLQTKYSYYGCDIMECRAVFSVLPDRFENDQGGEKLAWLHGLRER
jgi:hypothetical protein